MCSRPDPAASKLVRFQCTNQKCSRIVTTSESFQILLIGTHRRTWVRELDIASRNCCDATRWRDDFSDQAHPPQRQAVRMHLHPAHDCDTQFQKLQHREKLVHPARKTKKIRKNPYKLEHVANTRHGYGPHVGCSSQLVKINQKLELF